MASLVPDYVPTLDNFREAWASADFLRYDLNTAIICGGILAVQIVTMSLAAYAFARLEFPGRTFFFYLFLIQLMLVPIVLLVPNLATIAQARPLRHAARRDGALFRDRLRHLPDAPGLSQSIPRELEDAALMDGARWWQRIRHIYLPLAKPVADRLLDHLRHRALERISLAADGDQFAGSAPAHRRARHLHPRRRGRAGLGRDRGRHLPCDRAAARSASRCFSGASSTAS